MLQLFEDGLESAINKILTYIRLDVAHSKVHVMFLRHQPLAKRN